MIAPTPWATHYDGHGGVYIGDANDHQIGFLSLRKEQEAHADLFKAAPALLAENQRLRAALERISRWHGEFPDTGQAWKDGTPVSYEAAFGSTGARDYMRLVADEALAGEPAFSPRT